MGSFWSTSFWSTPTLESATEELTNFLYSLADPIGKAVLNLGEWFGGCIAWVFSQIQTLIALSFDMIRRILAKFDVLMWSAVAQMVSDLKPQFDQFKKAIKDKPEQFKRKPFKFIISGEHMLTLNTLLN